MGRSDSRRISLTHLRVPSGVPHSGGPPPGGSFMTSRASARSLLCRLLNLGFLILQKEYSIFRDIRTTLNIVRVAQSENQPGTGARDHGLSVTVTAARGWANRWSGRGFEGDL